MTSPLARIYVRNFKNAADAKAFVEAAKVIEDRISAVELRYRLYQCAEDPAIIYEIWEYPDEDSMLWVQSSMEGATVIPRTLDPTTKAVTAHLVRAFDFAE